MCQEQKRFRKDTNRKESHEGVDERWTPDGFIGVGLQPLDGAHAALVRQRPGVANSPLLHSHTTPHDQSRLWPVSCRHHGAGKC